MPFLPSLSPPHSYPHREAQLGKGGQASRHHALGSCIRGNCHGLGHGLVIVVIAGLLGCCGRNLTGGLRGRGEGEEGVEGMGTGERSGGTGGAGEG